MRSIQTTIAYPLSSVKPLEGLLGYRTFCFEALQRARAKGKNQRTQSPINGAPLVPIGSVGGFHYGRCPKTGGLFLMDLPSPESWPGLLAETTRYRHAPKGFHAAVSGSRTENVYAPKLDWIQTTLRLQEIRQPNILEVTTPPSDFSSLLNQSGFFRSVTTVNEMDLCRQTGPAAADPFHAAVLLESLDRVDDPGALLAAVRNRLEPDGLLFLTALVSSGFDLCVLGLNNLYLCPPDRANCFSLQGLETFLKEAGFKLIEVSTPGVLDLEIVQAHMRHDPEIRLSDFEHRLLSSDEETRRAFQSFLQERGLSSFARIVGRKI
ncbi:MAG: methyltransferase domain-containing protein [Elusimicrobiota bacterium]|jgi:hypothetical protein